MKSIRSLVWTRLCFSIVSGCICAPIAHGASAVPDKVRAAYSSPSPTQGVLWVAQMGGKTNPEVSKRAFSKYRQTKDEKQLEDAYQTLREVVKPKPYPSLEGFNTIIKDAIERIPAAKSANAKDFIDASLLEELDRSGYIDGLYR